MRGEGRRPMLPGQQAKTSFLEMMMMTDVSLERSRTLIKVDMEKETSERVLRDPDIIRGAARNLVEM